MMRKICSSVMSERKKHVRPQVWLILGYNSMNPEGANPSEKLAEGLPKICDSGVWSSACHRMVAGFIKFNGSTQHVKKMTRGGYPICH